MSIKARHDFNNAKYSFSIKDEAILERSLSHNPDREARRVVKDRLIALAEKRDPTNPAVTQVDFYQAIEDFSSTADYHAANLDKAEADLSRRAFDIAVTGYMNLTSSIHKTTDVDVFGKSQSFKATILDKDLKTELPGKKRPDPHLAQQAIKTNTPISKLAR